MKKATLEWQHSVDVNKQLTQYQLFIKNLTAKSALKKIFLPCKIKIKSVFKIMRQPPGLVLPKQPFTQ